MRSTRRPKGAKAKDKPQAQVAHSDEDFNPDPRLDEESASEFDPDSDHSAPKSGKKRSSRTPAKPQPKPKRSSGRGIKLTRDSNTEADVVGTTGEGTGRKAESYSLRLKPSKNTLLLNQLYDVLPHLSIKGTEPSPNQVTMDDIELTFLGDLPNMPNRDFKSRVEKVKLTINWDPEEGESTAMNRMTIENQNELLEKWTKDIEIWRVFVWNAAVPAVPAGELRLFPEHQKVSTIAMQRWKYGVGKGKPVSQCPIGADRRYISAGGPLDVNICPTKQDAEKVAKEACRLLNKYPHPLSKSDFPNEVIRNITGGYSVTRMLVELLALQALRSDFDWRSIRPVFRSSRFTGGSYGLSPPVGIIHSRAGPTYAAKTFPAISTTKNEWSLMQIRDIQRSQDDIEALPQPPSWWGLIPTSPDVDFESTGLPVETMMKFIQHLYWKLFGYFGSSRAILEAPRVIVEVNRKNDGRGMETFGPFGGQPLFRHQSDATKGSVVISVSPAVAQVISGEVPKIRVNLSHDKIAMAMDRAHRVFIQRHGVLQAIVELFVSLQEFLLGKSALDHTTYCMCGDDVQKKRTTAHICMFCLMFQPCAKMALTEDGRLVCLRHFQHGSPEHDPMTIVSGKLSKMISHCDEREGLTFVPGQRERMKEAIMTKYIRPGNAFIDLYDGNRKVTWRDRSPAMIVSLDAIYPLWYADREWWVHHEQNIGLTTLFANYLKGIDIPILLASLGDAVRRQQQSGKEVEDIEFAIDHYSKIRNVIPHSIADRKIAAARQGKEWWPRYFSMMKSGVYDGSAPIEPYFERSLNPTNKRTSHWNKDEVLRLNEICRQIEASLVYNPKKLVLPRHSNDKLGLPGAPWLWNPRHCFEDHSWEYLSRLFSGSFQTMDEACDWGSDHSNESPETLFLTCVILWFILGGKDEILGIYTTVFIRHPARFSIGRALHVDPGTVMRTGWKIRHTKSLEDYDDSLRTITMETWAMNRAKSNFPVDPDSIEQWKEIMRQFPTSSKFWGTYPPNFHSAPPITWPSSWRLKNVKRKPKVTRGDDGDAHESADQSENSDSEAETDYDELDITSEDDKDLGPSEHSSEDKVSEDGEEAETSSGVDVDVAPMEMDVDSPMGNDSDFLGIDEELGPRETMATTISENAEWLLSLANYLPERSQARYNNLVLDWASRLSPDDVREDSRSRRDQFVSAITSYVRKTGENEFSIRILSNFDLLDWKSCCDKITHPFSEQEITTFCEELDRQHNLKYIEKDGAFVFKV